MNSQKFTRRAKDMIEQAINETKANNNTLIEPEHFLKVAIVDSQSILSKVLSDDERTQWKDKILQKIANFGRTSASSEPNLSRESASCLSTKDEYVSTDSIVMNILDLPRIKSVFGNTEDVKQRIKSFRGGKKIDSDNADDTEASVSKFAVEMVDQARRNVFDPVVGREREILEIMEILGKKTKSNAIMVGKPGVGKTAIVNGIAQKIAKGEAPGLKNCKIYNVDVGAMVAGTCHRGDFESRLKELIKEATESQGVILFIDEIHIILGAGKTSEGAMDAANLLKPALANGTLKCIGATTEDEYRKYVEEDPAFERRFVVVSVREPSIEDSITMLRGIRSRLELHHGIKISDNALVYAAKASKQYIPNRRLPDIAIDLIDSACASAVIALESQPKDIQEAKNKIWSLELEKTSLEQDFARSKDESILKHIDEINVKIESIQNSIVPLEEAYTKEKKHILEAKNLRKKLEENQMRLQQAELDRDTYVAYDLKTNVIPVLEEELRKLTNIEVIQASHVAEKISSWTGIPVSRLNMKENERLMQMPARIKRRIFGQDEAVHAIIDPILSSRVGLARKDKPIGAFLLLGPTGVGKTELAKAIATELFDDEKNMVVLDMSDYGNELSVTKLIGSTAGYVGYKDGGTLTEPVRRKPYNVVLLDELDLAHQSVLNVFYQLLDEGRVTDGKGVVVDFRNCVIIMTSNLGQEIISESPSIGPVEREKLEKLVLQRFKPPFVNRIDSVIYFNKLDRNTLSSILDYQLAELNDTLQEKNMKFTISGAVADDIITKCESSVYGARLIKRLIQTNFVKALTRILLKKQGDEELSVLCCGVCESQYGEQIGDYIYVY